MLNLESECETAPAGPPGKNSRNHGGARPGSGRKPNSPFSPGSADKVYAQNLLTQLLRDESQPAALRAYCAAVIVLKGTWVKYPADAPGDVEADVTGQVAAESGNANPADQGEAGEVDPADASTTNTEAPSVDQSAPGNPFLASLRATS